MIANLRRTRVGLAPILTSGMALIVSLSVKATTGAVMLSPLAEAGVVGGTGCDVASGVLVGLGIGGLLGCVPCGIASGVGSLIHLAVC